MTRNRKKLHGHSRSCNVQDLVMPEGPEQPNNMIALRKYYQACMTTNKCVCLVPKRLSGEQESHVAPKATLTEFPPLLTYCTCYKRCHGFICTPRLHLEVGTLALLAPAALELVGAGHVLHGPVRLKHGLVPDQLDLVLLLVACHLLCRHRHQTGWTHTTGQNSAYTSQA